MRIHPIVSLSLSVCALYAVFAPLVVQASETDGTIDPSNGVAYALNQTVGGINFAATNGDVQVLDNGLSGYAWGENTGWINLVPAGGGVKNDSEGNLSGYAWGENTGWINFDPTNGGVTIDSSGVFHGYAWGEDIGWISFNCANNNSCGTLSFEVATDWRPASVR